MSHANSPATCEPRRPTQSGCSRRSVLSLLPGALLAGWCGLFCKRSATAKSATGAKAFAKPESFSYTPSISSDIASSATMHQVTYIYDAQGRLVQELPHLPHAPAEVFTYDYYKALP